MSPGCANCYAETFAERFRGVPGTRTSRVSNEILAQSFESAFNLEKIEVYFCQFNE